jgi:hypothetical protein
MGLFNLFHGKAEAIPASIAELRARGDSYVRIGAADYALRVWSPSGFGIAPYDGSLIKGQLARVRFVLHDFYDREGELRIEDQVRVENIDATGLRAQWWHLPARKQVLLAAHFARKAAAAT